MHYEEKAQTYKATLKQFTIVSEEEVLHEEKIVEASRSDPTQFRVLYEKYYRAVYLFIYHKVDGKELAADLTSQTFLKALQHINRYEYRQLPFSAWLYRIATNETMQFFRKNKKIRKVMIDDTLLSELQEPEVLPDLDKLKMKLVNAIDTLKLDEVQLIELRFYEKKSFKEIGYILDITENNAKVKTYRLVEKLRKKMS
jgi:RNA polymerase sigma-70 factor (ECF subfamily)